MPLAAAAFQAKSGLHSFSKLPECSVRQRALPEIALATGAGLCNLRKVEAIMLAIILLPTAILLSLRLLHYIFASPPDREPLSEQALRVQNRLQSAAVIVLAVGVLASAWVYRQADPDAIDSTGVISYEMANGYAVPIHAADSKKYSRELERIGGKLGVFFVDVSNDITEAFHGRTLAYVLFALSLASCFGCLTAARAVSDYRDDPSGNQDGAPVPDPQPTPGGRTVRWKLKLMRRSRPARTLPG